MAEEKKPQRRKGKGSVYQRKTDGRWCGSVELPARNGGRRRKIVTVSPFDSNGNTLTPDKAEKLVIAKINKIKDELERHGDLPTEGQTLESWLNVWFTTIAAKKIGPKTARTYRSLLERHIIPTIGTVKLSALTPAHVRRVEAAIVGASLSSTTAKQAHSILSGALKAAEREGRVTRNVATLTDRPRKAKPQLAVLTAAEGRRVIDTVRDDRLGSRWAAALFTGARQGELLGLELDRIKGGMLDLSWKLQRLTWEHGCKTPCGAARGTECPARTITHPADWENRYLTGGFWLSRPKSEAGKRMVAIVPELQAMLEERYIALQDEPNPFGLMWTSDPKAIPGTRTIRPLDGSPIDASQDNKAWHAILKRARVTDVRLHDARHTTASMLLKAGVPEAGIMKILGHNSHAVTRGYQDVDEQQIRDWLQRAADVMAPAVHVGELPAITAVSSPAYESPQPS